MRRLLVAGVAACLWPRRFAFAAPEGRYPIRPLRLILPSTVGGTSDLLGRLLAQPLSEALGVAVVVDPRPGAAGQIALDLLAEAPPDGYTLLLANNATHAIVPGAQARQERDRGMRFVPVIKLARLPIVVVVSPALGVARLADLIAMALREPGTLSYASGDIGSTSHMAASLLFRRANASLVYIPYSGTSAAIRDVLAGTVPVLFTHLGSVTSLLQAGRLRALAVTGSHRMAEFPAIETVAEAGYANFDVTTWHGVVVPAGTPRAIVSRLYDELARIVAQPGMRRQLALLGMEPETGTPEQFAADIETDAQYWAGVIRATSGSRE